MAIVENRATGSQWEIPDGSQYNQALFTLVERPPGYGENQSSTPQDQGPETVKSGGIAQWLNDKIGGGIPGVPSLFDMAGTPSTDTVGGTVGGIVGPAALAALSSTPPGALATIGAGIVGGGGGQLIQDALTSGIDPMKEGIQAFIGGAGPLIGKGISGAQMTRDAILRKMPQLARLMGLPSLELGAGSQVATQGLPEIIDRLRSNAPEGPAQVAANFLEKKMMGGAGENPIDLTEAAKINPGLSKEYLAKLADMLGATPQVPERMSAEGFDLGMDRVGALTRKDVSSKVSGRAYKDLNDLLRAEAPSNSAAQTIIDRNREGKLLRNLAPSGKMAAITGGSSIGMWSLLHNPYLTGAAALIPFGGNALLQMGKAGEMNPYLTGIGNYSLQELQQLLNQSPGNE